MCSKRQTHSCGDGSYLGYTGKEGICAAEEVPGLFVPLMFRAGSCLLLQASFVLPALSSGTVYYPSGTATTKCPGRANFINKRKSGSPWHWRAKCTALPPALVPSSPGCIMSWQEPDFGEIATGNRKPERNWAGPDSSFCNDPLGRTNYSLV